MLRLPVGLPPRKWYIPYESAVWHTKFCKMGVQNGFAKWVCKNPANPNPNPPTFPPLSLWASPSAPRRRREALQETTRLVGKVEGSTVFCAFSHAWATSSLPLVAPHCPRSRSRISAISLARRLIVEVVYKVRLRALEIEKSKPRH